MAKVYQVWKGSNKFLCGGRLIFGPDVRSLYISLVLISVPGILFCVFVASKFTGKVTAGIAVLPAAISLLVWVLGLLLFTASRDPGIVPRNSVPPEPEEDLADSGSFNTSAAASGRRLPRTKDVLINGHTVKVKYCDTCMLYRPPRCSHCSVCNNCVERFDHHCPWVGQCIGKRNYRYFFLFVLSTTALCIFVFGMSAVYVKVLMDNSYDHEASARRRSVLQAMKKSIPAVVLMAYTFVAVWFVGGLTALHIYLMSTNQTTYENFRYRYDKKVNPHNRGVFVNVFETLCTPIPPSRNDFRAAASEGAQEPRPADRPLPVSNIQTNALSLDPDDGDGTEASDTDADVMEAGRGRPRQPYRNVAGRPFVREGVLKGMEGIGRFGADAGHLRKGSMENYGHGGVQWAAEHPRSGENEYGFPKADRQDRVDLEYESYHGQI